jgi:tetratricopeptide (TPR) repeat protein
MWHYARGLAFAAKGEMEHARAEREALAKVKADPKTGESLVGFASGEALLSIAENVLVGELAAKEGDFDSAIARLEKGVHLEDGLMYNEPPDWYYPVRHTLGAVLMEAGREREAEIVYWEDLKRNPENGWALYGLWKALDAQGRDDEAADAQARFEEAWSAADTQLASSRF